MLTHPNVEVPIYLPYIHRPIIVRERTPGMILSSHRGDDPHDMGERWIVHLRDARRVLQSLVEECTRGGCIE